MREAQQRLLSLRAQRNTAVSPQLVSPGAAPSVTELPISAVPNHLGWGTGRLADLLRPHQKTAVSKNPTAPSCTPKNETLPHLSMEATPKTVGVFPDIAITLLQENRVAAGRVWLLLKELDGDGKGWFFIDEIRQWLTDSQSSLRLCGWRHLRNLLNRGDGFFWRRQNGRIWLRSVARVAASLGISQLRFKPVRLDISLLTGSIGTLRAHLYATLHSGRSERAKQKDSDPNPIARATIEAMTAVSPRIQRLYERTARVQRRTHIAVGPQHTPDTAVEAAWQHGMASFKLIDFRGRHGRPGQQYVAWQLPNSYAGPHPTGGKRQLKRINRQLVDLFHKGIAGNSQPERVRQPGSIPLEKRYFANGRLAAKAMRRPRQSESVYWRQSHNGRSSQVWHVMSE